MVPEEVLFAEKHEQMLRTLAEMYQSVKDYEAREKHNEAWAKKRKDQLTILAQYAKLAKQAIEAIHEEADAAYRRGFSKGKERAERGTLRPTVWNPFDFHPEVIQKVKHKEAQRLYLNSRAKTKWHDHY